VALPETLTVPETMSLLALVEMVQCNVFGQADCRSNLTEQVWQVTGLGYGADRVTLGQSEGMLVKVAVGVNVVEAVTVGVAVPVRVEVQVTVTVGVKVAVGVELGVELGVEVVVKVAVAVRVDVVVGVKLGVCVEV
jgi:hypothetical protein